ncbi:hypothetical protein BDQ94DRAFT_167826 [Aspergillus welwitschiae]|uniref:Lysine-specific metallo-endopeptidase domain-containing protein n=1 Tax=Aspergillus welwitschiae TaxID=1341132 RepID=A0A3F3QBQ8_9EURO|nr:hypothetical protein BDQ94DRAFT_167826 [Aspergillus welwitschiae]RDH36206.1 hypothetical protein BDQ94DRAFT_167826 [Aspergillus welwitschiae]
MVKWVATVMSLFWVLFLCHALAFPFEPFPSEVEVVPSANGSDHAPRHLAKRASRYPRVKYGSTCSVTQQEYLETELDEIQTMMTRVTGQLQIMRAVIREKEQPATWDTRFKENSRILGSWAAMMGRIRFNHEFELEDKTPNLVPWRTTSQNMQFTMSVYNRIRNVLRDRTLSVTIHCDDTFYVFDKDASTTDARIYRDTRSTETPLFTKLTRSGRLCHEGGGGNGWQMWNKVTLEDEICICPRVFDRAKSSQTLSSLENTMDSLRGRDIDDIKTFTAAGSLLHELSHCQSILGDDATEDLSSHLGPPYPDIVIPGYQRKGVWTLSKADPRQAHRNADSLTFFALALYYSACDWSKGICGAELLPFGFWSKKMHRYMEMDYDT